MTADVGTLQRLPRLIGDGMARELAYTARKVDAAEAKEIRLVNRVFDTPEALSAGVRAIAADIAAKAPLAIRGVKEMITYARPLGRGRPQLQRHLERGHADVGRPAGSHDVGHEQAPADVQGLTSSIHDGKVFSVPRRNRLL